MLILSTNLSCVDILPLNHLEDKQIIVAECELISSDSIIASIYYSGNTNGVNPSPIDTSDSYLFSLSLANVDSGFQFIQNVQNPMTLSIETTRLKIEAGKSYRFSGRNPSESLFSNVLRMPDSILLRSIEITNKMSSSSESMILDCEIILDGHLRQYEYLHIKVIGRGEEEIKYDFSVNARYYKTLKHRDGFLINNKEMHANEIKFSIILPKDYPHKDIEIKMGNITDTYYYHNLFLSDNISSSQFNPQNPITYPLNIESPKAIGIFSAATFSERFVPIQ